LSPPSATDSRCMMKKRRIKCMGDCHKKTENGITSGSIVTMRTIKSI
jgi:hypothetical protein